ncbi:MAG: NFACT RNA binding domain-containing protein [Acutalibacteraceae bacterium]|nr:NFACT RNA binding domain-containing protein [Acutalibacteraceae bacterium]
MAFDGAFLHKITQELSVAVGCHVDKIYQPSRDELVLTLRKKGFAERLLITTKSGNARLHFTANKYENPENPPMFCMLMRKYLNAARLVDIMQPNLERVAVLTFSSSNEMGDIVEIKLVCELIGNKANIILVNENGRIIDSLRHSDVESGGRLILPNAVYEFPEAQDKLNPLTTNISDIIKKAEETSYLKTVDGFSPLICREIEESENPKERFLEILYDLKTADNPVLILDNNNLPFDFTFTDIKQYGSTFKTEKFESFSALLDGFYTKKETVSRINSSAKDIIKLINNLKNRTEKKISLRLLDLEKCKNRETLRIYGELIKANLYSIKNGSEFAEVVNYYDSELKTVKIPLNPAISPSANANKYFKDYKKSYTAEQTLTALIEKDRKELEYFDAVLDSINRSSTLSDLQEIREELEETGYIKRTKDKRKKGNSNSVFKEYTSREGYRILVGKNNRQNDLITTQIASKLDLWFHTKDIAGSHVLVMSGGKVVSDQTVLQAATLAAKNSKAAASSKVAVDYTPVKFVKKPNGAKPGMVIYTTNKTIFVNPTEELV